MAERESSEEKRARQDAERNEYREARRQRLGHVEEYESKSEPVSEPEVEPEPEPTPKRSGKKKKEDAESEA